MTPFGPLREARQILASVGNHVTDDSTTEAELMALAGGVELGPTLARTLATRYGLS